MQAVYECTDLLGVIIPCSHPSSLMLSTARFTRYYGTIHKDFIESKQSVQFVNAIQNISLQKFL